MPAYNDALNRYRFFCRYMAFIDLDEFIFPKTNQSIVEVADEIFSRDSKTVALGINRQIFGSNGHETADYSKGVLERFTCRAPSDWHETEKKIPMDNLYVKSVINPRRAKFFGSAHYANYFEGFYSVNENGEKFFGNDNSPVTAQKIVVNHYYTKSREEFLNKVNRGRAEVSFNYLNAEIFARRDRNEIFDDGILKYRAARAENFSLESDAQRRNRVEKILINMMTKCSPFDAPPEFFTGKLETFLTCRKLAEVFGTRIGNKSAEEYALVWIYQTLNTHGILTYADLQLFVEELPEILSRPFPVSKKVARLFSEKILPAMSESAKLSRPWKELKDINFLRHMLNLILG